MVEEIKGELSCLLALYKRTTTTIENDRKLST